ncbi:MAG: hypothetical protein ACJ8F7_06830, partial [Gemmataceae bacterium]
MCELLALYFLGKQIGAMAESKGRGGMLFVVMFIALWLGGESCGAIVGIGLAGGGGKRWAFAYFFALLGAGIGAASSFAIVALLLAAEADEAPLRLRKGRHAAGDDDDDDRPRRRRRAPRASAMVWAVVGGVVALVIGVSVAGAILLIHRGRPGGGDAGGSNPKIVRMPGLVAYWSFDSIEAGKVVDHSGHNNHATLVGARL